MAYEPNTWSVGDVITDEKMNHIEQGILEVSQSGGYDAEVLLFNDSNSSHDPVLTIISGNFATLKDMVGSGDSDENIVPPNILARVHWYGAGTGTTSVVAVYYVQDTFIRFSLNVQKIYQSDTAPTIMFDWNSDDTLTV